MFIMTCKKQNGDILVIQVLNTQTLLNLIWQLKQPFFPCLIRLSPSWVEEADILKEEATSFHN